MLVSEGIINIIHRNDYDYGKTLNEILSNAHFENSEEETIVRNMIARYIAFHTLAYEYVQFRKIVPIRKEQICQ